MRVRILSAVVTSAAILALLAVFWVQSDTLFGARLREMRQIETDSLRSFVQTLLEAKRYTLEVHRRRWERDLPLAKAILFEKGIDAMETRARQDSDFDLVRIEKGSDNTSAVAIENRGDEPWLLSRSPLRLFDETVGRLTLGYRLNGNIAAEIARATKSRVRFEKTPPGREADLVYASVPLTFNASLSSLQTTTQSLRGSVLWVGGLCLFLIFLLVLVQRRLEMRSRTEAVGKIAAQVAHDLRSPLAVLEIAVQSDGSQDLIRMTLDRIRKIIRDLDEKKTPSRFTVELAPLARTIVEEKISQYREHADVEIRSQLRADVSASLDPVEFQRILSNLIDNSVQALPKGGKVDVSLTHEGSAARLQIRDNGTGIPEALLPKLFKRGASFGKKNGNGLGLWHARKMAERWGGKLRLATELHRGTEVLLEIPVA